MHTVGLPRTCLGFTNIFFFLIGFVGAVICVWCVVNTQFFQDVNYTITKSSLVNAIAEFVNLKLWVTPLTTILIVLSVLTMMTSCCGILGAGCKVKCAIKSYIFLVTAISSVAFWLIFISGVYNIYTKNENTRHYLVGTIQSSYGKENDAITYFWDYVMMDFQCCGVNGYQDFANSNWQKTAKKLYPVQCCKLENRTALLPVSKDCTLRVGPDIQGFAETGCFEVLSKSLSANKGKMIFYIILLSFSYAILMLFAYCISRGEPLLGAMAGNFSFLPSNVHQNPNEVIPARQYVEPNTTYIEEPPKKVVKVVSAVNPFQSYKFAPNAYQPSAPYAHQM